MTSLANLAVNKCLRITSNDKVVVFFAPHNFKLAEEIADECHKQGADVLLDGWSDQFYKSFMTRMSVEALREPSVWCRELTRISTATFWMGGISDPAVFRVIPPERMAANEEAEAKAHFPLVLERKVRSLALGIGQVTKPRAKTYGFNYNSWTQNTKAASSADPEVLSKKGKQLAERLAGSAKIHLSASNGTDLTFSVQGRKPQINDGIVDDQDVSDGALFASLPAGSVNVAVQEDSANGKVVLDIPTPWAGRTIRRLTWSFENGRVTVFDGDQNAQRLKTQWEKAAGDKDRIGWLSIGLNPRARFGFLNNDIVAGAVGIGIGGNEDGGGKNKSGFWHSQVLGNATLQVNGTPVVNAGKLPA